MSKAENAKKTILNFIKLCSQPRMQEIVSEKIQNFGNGETGVIAHDRNITSLLS